MAAAAAVAAITATSANPTLGQSEEPPPLQWASSKHMDSSTLDPFFPSLSRSDKVILLLPPLQPPVKRDVVKGVRGKKGLPDAETAPSCKKGSTTYYLRCHRRLHKGVVMAGFVATFAHRHLI